jgi:hypothetical protein
MQGFGCGDLFICRGHVSLRGAPRLEREGRSCLSNLRRPLRFSQGRVCFLRLASIAIVRASSRSLRRFELERAVRAVTHPPTRVDGRNSVQLRIDGDHHPLQHHEHRIVRGVSAGKRLVGFAEDVARELGSAQLLEILEEAEEAAEAEAEEGGGRREEGGGRRTPPQEGGGRRRGV